VLPRNLLRIPRSVNRILHNSGETPVCKVVIPYSLVNTETTRGNDFHRDQPLFQTSWLTGITDEIMQRAIEYLNAE
jgi:hypothetical protein